VSKLYSLDNHCSLVFRERGGAAEKGEKGRGGKTGKGEEGGGWKGGK
jgi:hypothetical protein